MSHAAVAGIRPSQRPQVHAAPPRHVDESPPHPFYADKLETLCDLFGRQDVRLGPNDLRVGETSYPIIDDVIVLLDARQWPARLRQTTGAGAIQDAFAPDIQRTFGDEWVQFPDILPEHRQEFDAYFDLVDPRELRGKRVCDLGCGIGRWSHFLAPHAGELVLVDFSEAIFVARRNLASAPRTLFFMGDIRALPFRRGFADLVVCLGVLHHLPTPVLDEVRALGRHSPRSLVYLYYALDNRPAHQRAILRAITRIRLFLASRWNPTFREAVTWLIAVWVYAPLILLGHMAGPWGRHVPLHEGYRGKSLERIRQDVYDRFFTRIEQRVTKRQVLELRDTFARVTVSEKLPYWHFLVEGETKS